MDTTKNNQEANAPSDPPRRQFLKQAGMMGVGFALPLQNNGGGGHDASPPPEGGQGTLTRSAFAEGAVINRQGTRPATPLDPLPMTNTGPGQIPRKPLGSTGLHTGVLGLGGATLGRADTYEIAERILHEAVDAGVNFLDNAWEYNDHKSEEWMGRALQGRRDKVVLMTKVCTHGRDAKVGMQMLEESLRRLRTDHLDVWQIHECVYWNDPDLHFMQGGVVEALAQAKQQGKVRFVGFTGHKNPMIHLRMLALADQRGVKFDTAQMPLNAFDATYRSFEQQVLPELLKRGMGALGMKSLGGSAEAVLQGAVTIDEALRYAMSLPASTTISGMDTLETLHQNLAIARDFKPYTAQEMQALRTRCANAASDGHLELYKSTKRYDAAVGRQQHGYPDEEELPI